MLSQIVRPGQLPADIKAVKLASQVPAVKAKVQEMLDKVKALDNTPVDQLTTSDQVALVEHPFGSPTPAPGLFGFLKKPIPAPTFSGTAEFAADGTPKFMNLEEEKGKHETYYFEQLPDGSRVYGATLDKTGPYGLAEGVSFIERKDGTLYLDESAGCTFDISLPMALLAMNSDTGGKEVRSERPDTLTVLKPVVAPPPFEWV